MVERKRLLSSWSPMFEYDCNTNSNVFTPFAIRHRLQTLLPIQNDALLWLFPKQGFSVCGWMSDTFNKELECHQRNQPQKPSQSSWQSSRAQATSND